MPIADKQIVELLGRNRLVTELLRAGLEVARPERDRGVDLIAYADLQSHVETFVAVPIQMKAASTESFGLDRKYARLRNLLIAYVWHLEDPNKAVTYAMTYAEALDVVNQMNWARTDSWVKGGLYVTSAPSQRLRLLLEPHRMTADRWWQKVTGVAREVTGETPL